MRMVSPRPKQATKQASVSEGETVEDRISYPVVACMHHHVLPTPTACFPLKPISLLNYLPGSSCWEVMACGLEHVGCLLTVTLVRLFWRMRRNWGLQNRGTVLWTSPLRETLHSQGVKMESPQLWLSHTFSSHLKIFIKCVEEKPCLLIGTHGEQAHPAAPSPLPPLPGLPMLAVEVAFYQQILGRIVFLL